MTTTPTAPSISASIRFNNVAANFIDLEWNPVGDGFIYDIYRNDAGVWVPVAQTTESHYYDSDLDNNTEYSYKIRVLAKYYIASSFTYSEPVVTFDTNSYSITHKTLAFMYDDFITKKFLYNDNYIDFNVDDFSLVLMRHDYKYNSAHINIDDPAVINYVIKTDEDIALYGETPAGCGGFGCTVPVLYRDAIILFEKNQENIKISYNRGKNWSSIRALHGRAGHPYHDAIYTFYGDYEAGDQDLIVLGYNKIYITRDPNTIHWSSIDHGFSEVDIQFTKPNQRLASDLQFSNLVNYPSGVFPGLIDGIVSDGTDYLYAVAGQYTYRFNITTPNVVGNSVAWDNFIIGFTSNIKVRNLVNFNNEIYAFCPGTLNGSVMQASADAGVYHLNTAAQRWDRVWGNTSEERLLIEPNQSNLTRTATKLLLGVQSEKYDIIDNITSADHDLNSITPMSTKERPYRHIFTSTDGLSWTLAREKWQYEEQYLWNNGDRVWINDLNRISVIHREHAFEQDITTAETFVDGTLTVTGSNALFENFPGYTLGAILYEKASGYLVCYNSLPIKSRVTAEITWLRPDVVVKGILKTRESEVPAEIADSFNIPLLTPFAERFLPEHYIYDEPKFVEFSRLYLKYISDGSLSNYGQLWSLLRTHDANETIFTDMFQSDLSRRNIRVPAAKQAEITKLLYNRGRDFYSIKGTEDSYKFLFRLLYNKEVNVKIENSYDFLYQTDVAIKTANGVPITSYTEDEIALIGLSLVGQKIQQMAVQTATSSSIPVYGEIVSAVYKEMVQDDSFPTGTLIPVYTINMVNVYSQFEVDKDLEVQAPDYYSVVKVTRGINIIKNDFSADSFLDQNFNFNYVIRIESDLPISRYYDDVIRFVHPVGFDFIGAYLITSFVMNQVPAKHIETIIDFYQGLRWDSGAPSVYPKYIPDLSGSLQYQYTDTGLLKVKDFANSNDAFPLPGGYPTDTVYGVLATNRRKKNSPLFDSSWGRFYDMITNPEKPVYVTSGTPGEDTLDRVEIPRVRLKDNLADPDNASATQRKKV